MNQILGEKNRVEWPHSISTEIKTAFKLLGCGQSIASKWEYSENAETHYYAIIRQLAN